MPRAAAAPERSIGWFALAMTLGCALVWGRSGLVAGPRVDRPIATFDATVEMVERLVAKGDVHMTLAQSDAKLPPRVRVSAPEEDVPAGLSDGARVRIRARLTGLPPIALPGTYDFARDSWFKQIGAVGRALGQVQPPTVVTVADLVGPNPWATAGMK